MTGTTLRTILTVATCLNTAMMATDITSFGNEKVNAAYKIISIVLNFIIVAISTYYNNDYSDTAATYTGMMRQAKAQKKSGYIGEDFTSPEEPEPEEEESDEE